MAKCKCNNCGHECDATETIWITNRAERVDPGGPEPAGECPECGCLSYPVDPQVEFFLKECNLSNPEAKIRTPIPTAEKEYTFAVYISGKGKTAEEAWEDCLSKELDLEGGDIPELYCLDELDEDGDPVYSWNRNDIESMMAFGLEI